MVWLDWTPFPLDASAWVHGGQEGKKTDSDHLSLRRITLVRAEATLNRRYTWIWVNRFRRALPPSF